MENDLISVVIPVYQNSDTLTELYAQIVQYLPSSKYVLIFVNDCSTDSSLDVLKTLSTKDPRIIIISLSKNMGQHQAITYGLSYSQGDIVIVMDADLQDPPQAIPLLIDSLKKQNVAAVFAGRRGMYSSWNRRLTSIVFKASLSVLSGCRLPADAGLFMAIDREMVKRILLLGHPSGYILNAMAKSGLKMTSIPVKRAEFTHTNYTFQMRLQLGINIVMDMLGLKPKKPLSRADEPILSFFGQQFDTIQR